MPHIGTTELLIVFAMVLLLFGARKVPELARSLGQGMRELRQGMREAAVEEDAAPASAGPSPAAP